VLNAYEERGLAFMLSYGMTESSPGATSVPARYSRAKAGSSGLPHYFVDMRIRDEQNADAPVGEVGEIQLRGPNVIAEYWNKPEASRDSFVDANWFKTGDMGYVDADGFLFVADRIKDMLISGGENIYPAEVEQIIFELEGVTGVALIGVPDEKWGEVPWAILTMAGGATVTLEQVRAHLDNRVARYKMPKNVIIVDEFPRTASGKIRKADLRKRYA
jgi:fatty-acyl-CoA synthase